MAPRWVPNRSKGTSRSVSNISKQFGGMESNVRTSIFAKCGGSTNSSRGAHRLHSRNGWITRPPMCRGRPTASPTSPRPRRAPPTGTRISLECGDGKAFRLPCGKCNDGQIGREFLNIASNLKGGPPYQPWAADACKSAHAGPGPGSQRPLHAARSSQNLDRRLLQEDHSNPGAFDHPDRTQHAVSPDLHSMGGPFRSIRIRPGTAIPQRSGTETRWWSKPSASATICGWTPTGTL